MQSASSRALNCVSVEILFHNGELNLLWQAVAGAVAGGVVCVWD
jgi:hypothetical protein